MKFHQEFYGDNCPPPWMRNHCTILGYISANNQMHSPSQVYLDSQSIGTGGNWPLLQKVMKLPSGDFEFHNDIIRANFLHLSEASFNLSSDLVFSKCQGILNRKGQTLQCRRPKNPVGTPTGQEFDSIQYIAPTFARLWNIVINAQVWKSFTSTT